MAEDQVVKDGRTVAERVAAGLSNWIEDAGPFLMLTLPVLAAAAVLIIVPSTVRQSTVHVTGIAFTVFGVLIAARILDAARRSRNEVGGSVPSYWSYLRNKAVSLVRIPFRGRDVKAVVAAGHVNLSGAVSMTATGRVTTPPLTLEEKVARNEAAIRDLRDDLVNSQRKMVKLKKEVETGFETATRERHVLVESTSKLAWDLSVGDYHLAFTGLVYLVLGAILTGSF